MTRRFPRRPQFVIVSPRQSGGGAIVLHALAKYASELGYRARVFYPGERKYELGRKAFFWRQQIVFTITDVVRVALVKLFGEKPFLNNPLFKGYVNVSVRGVARKWLPRVTDDDVVVYSDNIVGNPLHATHVVRWLLYHYTYKDRPGVAYSESDVFYCYMQPFNDVDLNPQGRQLTTPYYDLELYKQTNFGERTGTCYVVRKGADRPDLPESFDGIVVDDLSEVEKVRVFNECKYCVSYDMQTAYSTLASICGCISVVVPEPGKTYDDYYAEDYKMYGVAFGFDPEQLAYSERTRSDALAYYTARNEESRAQAQAFVEDCKELFFS
ncbi:MAG: hypothetical protein K6F70_00775 [Eggerthellaceae bacterium]|nr:hypothetical protein [Eggerthellaceae bacterium]